MLAHDMCMGSVRPTFANAHKMRTHCNAIGGAGTSSPLGLSLTVIDTLSVQQNRVKDKTVDRGGVRTHATFVIRILIQQYLSRTP